MASQSTTPSKPDKRTAICSIPPGEPVPIIKGSQVYLIDGSGYIFRAFHALPPLTRPSDGLPVGAVHGFCAMLWKLLQDARRSTGPTHIAVIFDASEKTFRNDIYKDYKAHRPPAPEELVPQFSLIRDAVKAFNIACIEQYGFEADDLIATYAMQTVKHGGDVTIVSSDKDLMQLVRPGISMLDTMKNRSIGPDEVRERFGVAPERVVDVQALAGDFIDNVPGVPGIGVKTAAELINEYGDLETLLSRAIEIKQPKRRERLIEYAIQARLSLDLVKLKDDVPLEVAPELLGVRDPDAARLLAFLREMEFATLTKRIAEGLGASAPPPAQRDPDSSAGPVARDARQRTRVSRSASQPRPEPGRQAQRLQPRSGRQGENRAQPLRNRDRSRSPRGLDCGGARRRPVRLRYRNHQPRPHAGRIRWLLNGGCAGQGLLCADRASPGQ